MKERFIANLEGCGSRLNDGSADCKEGVTMIKIDVLFCFHNRKSLTTRVVDQLMHQEGIGCQFQLRMYAVDDGSTDGTSEEILQICPSIQIYRADGSWFWAKSMAYLYQNSKQGDADFILMLNDDVSLLPNATTLLLADWNETQLSQSGISAVIVGKTKDRETGVWTYGGHRTRNPKYPLLFLPGNPGEGLVPCITFNCNCVLIPNSVARIFSMDGEFSHAFADIDLGLKMHSKNVPIFQSKEYIGFCSRNSNKGTWKDETLGFWKRLRLINTRKGMPFRNRLRYTRRHGGWIWPLFFIHPYVKFFLSFIKKSA